MCIECASCGTFVNTVGLGVEATSSTLLAQPWGADGVATSHQPPALCMLKALM